MERATVCSSNSFPWRGSGRSRVVFKPYPDGPEEQRFFHMQEFGTDNRVMFETRLTDDGRWFLDTFILSGAGSHPMYAEDYTHPIGPWY